MLHDQYGFLNEMFCEMEESDKRWGPLGSLLDFMLKFHIRTKEDIESIEDVVDVRAPVEE